MRNMRGVGVLGLLLCAQVAEARGPFVGQLPNGNSHSCRNCHTEAAGGSPLNAFGTATGVRPAGDGGVLGFIEWSAYARLDSDGDGFTNGQELGDPCGDWVPGQAQPTLTTVGNPGEAASVPTGAPAACTRTDSGSSSGSSGEGGGAGCSSSGAQVPAWALLGLMWAWCRRQRRS
jgi:hypothetical protein